MRALPSGIRSEYLDVSSRAMYAWLVTFRLPSHFTQVLPSHRGLMRRSGYPCDGRMASPFCPYARKLSLIALASGMLRIIRQASAPSAITHAAPGRTPTSASSSESDTPVHSLPLTRPWLRCTSGAGCVHSPPLLPPHSRTRLLVSEGSRGISSIDSDNGRSTIP